MKIKQFLALVVIFLLSACSGPATPPESKKISESRTHKTEERKAAASAAASNISAYQRELALRISQLNSSLVYPERPQALLRSVIVLRYHLNAEGKLMRSEIVRSNHDKNTETIAAGHLHSPNRPHSCYAMVSWRSPKPGCSITMDGFS